MNKVLTENTTNLIVVHRLQDGNNNTLFIKGKEYACTVNGNFLSDKVSLTITRISSNPIKAMSNAFWNSLKSESECIEINEDNFNLIMDMVTPFNGIVCKLEVNPYQIDINEIKSHISVYNNSQEMQNILDLLKLYFT